ncbi:MAG: REP-associated tyrosine transposase [Verrucomicrobiota bacterium]
MPRPSVNPKPHSEDLRRNRLTDSLATFFVTKSLHPKKPVLDSSVREVVISALLFAVQHERIYLRTFVVMPDHWHALLALREQWTLPKFMHDMMSYVGAKTSGVLKLHETSWQDGYYDTRVKTAKQFAYVTHYIEQNPVAKGLVETADKWDATSAGRQDLITDPWPWLFNEE